MEKIKRFIKDLKSRKSAYLVLETNLIEEFGKFRYEEFRKFIHLNFIEKHFFIFSNKRMSYIYDIYDSFWDACSFSKSREEYNDVK